MKGSSKINKTKFKDKIVIEEVEFKELVTKGAISFL